MTESEGIDVALPTNNSAGVLAETLDALARSIDVAGVAIGQVIFIDNESEDGTEEIATDRCKEHDWTIEYLSYPCRLPDAREKAIELVEKPWFLFLDDDVRLTKGYLRCQFDTISPMVGAIQGRKMARDEPNSEWVRRRARRGGTHATLCRREAVAGVSFPKDLTVLEDEYLRRYVEDSGYLWVFNHQARFSHETQDRHPIGWREGYLAGKYGLKTFHEYALNVPYAAFDGRNPAPHVKRAIGWLAGRFGQRFTEPTTLGTHDE